MQTLLANVSRCQVVTAPFPHIVVEDALPEDLYLQLASQYPSTDLIGGGAKTASNQRLSLPASKALHNPEISPLWREFVRLHTSPTFFDLVVKLFAEELRQVYPSLEKNIGPLEKLRTGVRYVDDFARSDVLLDAQICVNTPVTAAPSSVRRTHVDAPTKLFAGLYYLRHQEDSSSGGNLELARFKGEPESFKGASVPDESVEVVKTVKYRRNVLVLFINSYYSLHAVTPRSVTPLPRYLFNLVGEVKRPLFDLSRYQAVTPRGGWRRMLSAGGRGAARRLFDRSR